MLHATFEYLRQLRKVEDKTIYWSVVTVERSMSYEWYIVICRLNDTYVQEEYIVFGVKHICNKLVCNKSLGVVVV